MYYVLVNNEIHNLLQFTTHVLLTQNSHLYTYLTPNLHFSIQKTNCAGPEEAVFEYG